MRLENTTTVQPYLENLAPGVHAYIQPSGTWGYGNAGVISDGHGTLLVDTLNDLRTTQAMLNAIARVSNAPFVGLVNTSGASDHCWGNQLIAGDGVDVIATCKAWEDLQGSAPDGLHKVAKLKSILPREMRRVAKALTDSFSFKDIRLMPPTRFVTESEQYPRLNRDVHLIPLGNANAPGALAVWLPDEKVLFAGDAVLGGHTPSLSGSVDGWLAALETLARLSPTIIIPGHGLPGGLELLEETKTFLTWFDSEVRRAQGSGMSPTETVARLHATLPLSPVGCLGEPERLVLAVHEHWSTLVPGYKRPTPPVLFTHLGKFMAA